MNRVTYLFKAARSLSYCLGISGIEVRAVEPEQFRNDEPSGFRLVLKDHPLGLPRSCLHKNLLIIRGERHSKEVYRGETMRGKKGCQCSEG